MEKEIIKTNTTGFIGYIYELKMDINALYRDYHFHTEAEIVFIKNGSLKIEIENDIKEAHTGQVIYIGSSTPHCLKPLSKICEIIILQADFKQLSSVSNANEEELLYSFVNKGKLPDFELFDCQKAKELAFLINKIYYENNKKDSGYLLYSEGCYILIAAFLSRNKLIVDNKENFQNKNINRILPVVKFVCENYFLKIQVEDAAEILHLDKYYFCKFFKKLTGDTFNNFLNFVRIEKACYYLIKSQKNITEIALDCGFSSIQHFDRTFKKAKGITAIEYKNHYKFFI